MNFSYLENTFVQLFQCLNQCWVDKIYLKYFLLFLRPRSSGVRNQACTVASILGIMCNSGTSVIPQTQSCGTLKIDIGLVVWILLALFNPHCRYMDVPAHITFAGFHVPAEAPVGDVNISILCWDQTADITTLARLGRPKLQRHSNITSKCCSSFQTALLMLAGGLNGLIWAGPHSVVWRGGALRPHLRRPQSQYWVQGSMGAQCSTPRSSPPGNRVRLKKYTFGNTFD